MTETILTGRREGSVITVDQDINWGDLASSPYGSWSNWNSWKVSTGLTVSVQIDDDQGSEGYRVPLINVEKIADSMTISLKISSTGTFTGEETTINFVEDTPVTYATGRYYRWTVTLTGSTAPYLLDYFTQYNENLQVQTLEDVDVFGSYTTTLSTDLGLVRNIQATALQGEPYVEADYIIESQGSEYLRTAKTLTNSGSVVIDTATKKFGTGSFYWDADRLLTVDMLQDNDHGSNDFTYETWVNVDSSFANTVDVFRILNTNSDSAAAGAIRISGISNATGGTENLWRLDYDIDIDDTQYGVSLGLSPTLAYDTWHHVAFVREGSSLRLFANGSLLSTETITGSGVADDTTSTLYLGSGDGNYYRGYIDEARISSSARYTSAFTPQPFPFTNDANTLLLLHADDFTDDGGTVYGDDAYIVVQAGGSPVIKQKNPPQVEVVDYSGNPWDGTVDVVLRGLPKVVYDGFRVRAVTIEGAV